MGVAAVEAGTGILEGIARCDVDDDAFGIGLGLRVKLCGGREQDETGELPPGAEVKEGLEVRQNQAHHFFSKGIAGAAAKLSARLPADRLVCRGCAFPIGQFFSLKGRAGFLSKWKVWGVDGEGRGLAKRCLVKDEG